jgi:hypothetical protein
MQPLNTTAIRTYHTARPFMEDLKERLANRVQLTSDGHRAYIDAVEETFGDDIDIPNSRSSRPLARLAIIAAST